MSCLKSLLQRGSNSCDGMTSNLTLRERQELQNDLERCRAKQAEEIVASVNQYQPTMKKKVSKNGTSGNQHTQSIEQILADALNDSLQSLLMKL